MLKKKFAVPISTHDRLRRILHRLWGIVFGRTTPQRFFRYYGLLIIAGAVLLYLPISLKTGFIEDGLSASSRSFNFAHALFMSSSSFSGTGMALGSTDDTFTLFGKLIILLLLQVGGIGVMTIKLLLWQLLAARGTGIGDRSMLQYEKGAHDSKNATRLILYSALVFLGVEVVCGFAMMLYFYYYPAFEQTLDTNPAITACVTQGSTNTASELSTCTPLTIATTNHVAAYGDWGTAAWWGFFHSISTLSGGMDIMGPYSMAAYRNDGGIGLQVIMIVEMVIGGLGFPLAFDVLSWIRAKARGAKFRFSLFTKLTIVTYGIILLIGFSLNAGAEAAAVANYGDNSKFFLLGYDNATGAWGQNEYGNKWMAIVFTTFSASNAGLSTYNTHILATSTKIIVSLLMFIGCAPASTAGGIRTTAVALMFMTVFRRMTGRKEVSLFKRTVPTTVIRNSFGVFGVALALVMIGTIIIQTSPYADNYAGGFGLQDALFETTSAFGTVGMSTGMTTHLAWWSLIYMTILMFIGQLGVDVAMLAWVSKPESKNAPSYAMEDLLIG